ncbi:PIN domain-containing protein [Leifsonia sp. NPDC056665]|uniref:PIN domain-containing protein n=1 Tax=Leifsonia sp. NPDC056665 TaxID=3345901 RepID=UPI0036794567
MIRLKPGATVDSALAALGEAKREANNVIGAGYTFRDLFAKYLEWAVNQERRLANAYGPVQIEMLIQTRRYWTIQSIAPDSYGPALSSFIQLELNDRIRQFESTIAALQRSKSTWNVQWAEAAFPEQLHAVVVDTNVFMRHATTIADLDWPAIIGRRPHESIGLVTLSVVIDELDSLKTASGDMTNVGGKTYSRRSLAQRALNHINATFTSDASRVLLREASLDPLKGAVPALQQMLILDDLEHTRLPSADAEIIDQALGIQSFARSATVVSYDSNLVFMARQLELGAHLFTSEPTQKRDGARPA